MVAGIYSSAQIKFAKIDETGSGDNEIVALVAGKILRVLAFSVTTTLANVLQWKSDTTVITGPMPVGAERTIDAEFAEEGHFEAAAGEALNLNAGTATAHGGWLVYVEV